MKFILGTTSELKKQSILYVLTTLSETIKFDSYDVLTKNAESGVPSTPYDEQTFIGANNRANEIFTNYVTEGDYFVGLESGIVERSNILFEECWCVIYNKQGEKFVGYSSGFMLPNNIALRMKNGETHIDLMVEHGKSLNLNEKDTWSIYSNNKIQREESIKESFRNAFLSITDFIK